jgi:uncharacterized membrane protein
MSTQHAQDVFGSRSTTRARPPTAAAAEPRSAWERSRRMATQAADGLLDARALGWLSIGLGLAAVLAPRPLARLTGLGEADTLLRLVGCRELASGAGLLTQRRTAPWLWARVAGDAMDLLLVGSAARNGNPGRRRAWTTVGVLAGIAAVDVAASVRATQAAAASAKAGASFSETLIVNKTPQECYDFWRRLSNLPKFTPALESVTDIDAGRSRWVMRGPLRTKLEWVAEITADEPGSHIGWRSVEGSQVEHAGVVRFNAAAGGRGTLVRVAMHYRPVAGVARFRPGKLIGAYPRFSVREDLRRFKQLIETGEIPSTRGQPSGRRSVFGRATPEGRLSNQGSES